MRVFLHPKNCTTIYTRLEWKMLYTLRNDYTSNAYGDNGVYLYLIIQFATSVMLYLLQLVLNIYIVALYFTTVSLCLRIDCRLTNWKTLWSITAYLTQLEVRTIFSQQRESQSRHQSFSHRLNQEILHRLLNIFQLWRSIQQLWDQMEIRNMRWVVVTELHVFAWMLQHNYPLSWKLGVQNYNYPESPGEYKSIVSSENWFCTETTMTALLYLH